MKQQEDRALLPTTSPTAAASTDNAVASSAAGLRTEGLVAAWYASNIGVLLRNKYLLSVYGFRYPVFLTACHMSACTFLSSLLSAATKSSSVGGEPIFHLFSFIVCVGATAGRALKTVLQGILLSSEEEKLNSMDLLRYMAPVAVLLVPATLIMEPEALSVAVALAVAVVVSSRSDWRCKSCSLLGMHGSATPLLLTSILDLLVP